MRLPRLASACALFVLGAAMLSGCSGALFTMGQGATSAAPTAAPGATHTAAPTPSPTAMPTTTPSLGGWSECPKIVGDLNTYAKNHPTPTTTYVQIKPADFPLKAVSPAVLNNACTIAVTVSGETVHWAILPGDSTLAASIKADLLNAGFAPGGVADIFSNTATGQAATIATLASGQALDAYLVVSSVFMRFTQPLVYIGSFTLS
jgi:hypothetical protein